MVHFCGIFVLFQLPFFLYRLFTWFSNLLGTFIWHRTLSCQVLINFPTSCSICARSVIQGVKLECNDRKWSVLTIHAEEIEECYRGLNGSLWNQWNGAATAEQVTGHALIHTEGDFGQVTGLTQDCLLFKTSAIDKLVLGGIAGEVAPHFLQINRTHRHIAPKHRIDGLEIRLHDVGLVFQAAKRLARPKHRTNGLQLAHGCRVFKGLWLVPSDVGIVDFLWI